MNQEVLLILSNLLTGLGAWFVGRRRQRVETDNTVLKNLELSVNLYREIVTDLKKEIEALNIKIQQLETKIDELHEENKKLKKLI